MHLQTGNLSAFNLIRLPAKKRTGEFLLVLRKNENYSEMLSGSEEYFP
jgi:hypothetical protein